MHPAPSPAAQSSPALRVTPYSATAGQWDDFVRRAPGGTFFHLWGWKKVIERTFGFRSLYLAAWRDGDLAGVLPLFELGSALLGRSLLSLPFAVEGGVCALDSEARSALEREAVRLCGQSGARSLELRDGREGAPFGIREGTYFRFRRPLRSTDAEDFAAIPRKQRRMVRVGQQSGLVARVDPADLGAFYDLYARSVRQLGTPVFPARYFRAFLETFPDDCVLLTVRYGRTPVAAVMSFFFKDTVLPYYAGSRHEFFRYAINDFMYWELMRHARARGARVFDFGRSKKGTGPFEFKRHWGFEPEPLRYRVYLPGGGRPPDRTANDERIQLLRRAWRRLPLPLTKLLGPFLIKRFGALYT
jgi:FemAB-related protein (PEP-CTERM system-associated)